MTDEAREQDGLTPEELEAEGATALPDKEVVSVLDLNADINLAIDAAAPIDLAVAANANVAAPINAAASANILSEGSGAQALGDQGALINQNLDANATADSLQHSGLDQSNDGTPATTSTSTNTGTDALNGDLLNVDVNVDANADVAAPIDGAVAANANVAAPINAGVAANVGSVDSDSVAVSQQDAIINQDLHGTADANTDQQSNINQ